MTTTSSGVPSSGGAVTLVNTFTVHGSAAAFEDAFRRTAAFIREQPGFLSHVLVADERRDEYVNIAHWTDAESLHAAVGRPEFADHVSRLRAVSTSTPRFYTPRQSASADGPGGRG